MSRRRLAVAALVLGVAALVAVGALLARDKTSGPADARPAKSAPAAPNIGGTDPVTGKPVSLAAFRGKPVVINIWASWCTGCNEEASDLRRFAAAHPEAQLIGVDANDSKSAARAFYARHGWSHPSIFDPAGSMADTLGLQGLPTTLFLNSRLEIVTRIVGASDFAGFEQGLAQAEGT